MMIHKITSSVDYNLWFKRLETKSNEPTNQNSIKDMEVVKLPNNKLCSKTLGTSVIISPMSPSFFVFSSFLNAKFHKIYDTFNQFDFGKVFVKIF